MMPRDNEEMYLYLHFATLAYLEFLSSNVMRIRFYAERDLHETGRNFKHIMHHLRLLAISLESNLRGMSLPSLCRFDLVMHFYVRRNLQIIMLIYFAYQIGIKTSCDDKLDSIEVFNYEF